MLLTSGQVEELVTLAKRDAPNETCGIIGGRKGRARQTYPLKNVSPNPRTEYFAEPLELLAALRDIEEKRDDEILAIFHSHPASPAFPSPTDIERAFYPQAVYILISLLNPEAVQVRGFHVAEGRVTEVTLEVVEEDDYGQARANPRRGKKTEG